MKPRSIAVGVLIAVAILAVLGLTGNRSAGPTYEGRTADSWLELYRTESLTGKEDARDAFSALGDKSTPYLLSILNRPDRSLLRFYRQLCSRLPPRIQKLLRVHSHEKMSRSNAASELLGAVHPSAAVLIPKVRPWLSRQDHPRYLLAIHLLGTIGEGAPEAAGLLAHTLQSTNRVARSLSAHSLQKLGDQAWPAVPALIAALNDRATHNCAITALGNTGSKAKDAVPHLERILEGNNCAAAAALHKINPEGNGLSFLIESLGDPGLRTAAVHQLGLLGPAAQPALAPLIEALRADRGNDGGTTWWSITEAIRRISPTNRVVLAFLVDKLNAAERRIQRNVRWTPGVTLSPYDERLNIAEKLVGFDASEPHGLAVLVETLQKDPESQRRSSAAYLIRQAAPGASAAIPALKSALQDKDQPVREAAASALRKIEQPPAGN